LGSELAPQELAHNRDCGAMIMSQILSTPQLRVGRLTRSERCEQFTISTKKRDGNGLIPAPLGGSKAQAPLGVETDDTLHLMQAAIEPIDCWGMGMMGASFGDNQRVFLHPKTRAVAGQHQGISSPQEIPGQVIMPEARIPPRGTISGDVTSGDEAAKALARGEVRRIGDNVPVPADIELKSMHAVVTQYFTHGEAKAANPYGMGELARRHIKVVGVDIIGKESNRLAQSAAEDTANLVGGREQFGSRNYGSATSEVTPKSANKPDKKGTTRPPQPQLSSLFDEEMPDLLAASCLSRRTIERVAKSQNEAQPETWTALELAMKELDPSNPEGIAGWREIITVEELARLLNISCKDAQSRFRGRTTWRESEHTRLIRFLMERRARLG
jgi:hypothetical protein